MKIYIPYLKNLDTLEYDQALGAFDSMERCKAELEKFANELEIDIDTLDYQIESFVLNKNILILDEQIIK